MLSRFIILRWENRQPQQYSLQRVPLKSRLVRADRKGTHGHKGTFTDRPKNFWVRQLWEGSRAAHQALKIFILNYRKYSNSKA